MLSYFETVRLHFRREKSLWKLTFAHQREIRKSLVPFAGRYVDVSFEPVLQFHKIASRNPTFAKAFKQVIQNA